MIVTAIEYYSFDRTIYAPNGADYCLIQLAEPHEQHQQSGMLVLVQIHHIHKESRDMYFVTDTDEYYTVISYTQSVKLDHTIKNLVGETIKICKCFEYFEERLRKAIEVYNG